MEACYSKLIYVLGKLAHKVDKRITCVVDWMSQKEDLRNSRATQYHADIVCSVVTRMRKLVDG